MVGNEPPQSRRDQVAAAASDFADELRGAGMQVAEAAARVKPRLRGRFHEWAFFMSLTAGAALIAAADTPRAIVVMTVYATCVSALFGASALYHRVNWRTVRKRMWMRRLDHSMIFLLIAGSNTPFLVVVDTPSARAMLFVVWAVAIAGVLFKIAWIGAPRWLVATMYLGTGWIGAVTLPLVWQAVGAAAVLLIAGGGLTYTVGALVYTFQRPDPIPAVFGYHEIFHILVIVAAGLHYSAVAAYVLPHSSLA